MRWIHFVLFGLAAGILSWNESFGQAAESGKRAPGLEPIFAMDGTNGTQRLMTESEMQFGKINPQSARVVFWAAVTNSWPAGLVPLFAVEKGGAFKLRRLPVPGQGNFSDPLFFGLPPEDEPESAKIAGRWDCQAIRGSGSKEYVSWDLSADAGVVAGRFDQNTQYRFAYVTGGSFRSNRFELRVEYIQDHYLLQGDWRDGKLAGEWQHLGGAERGAWEAERAPSAIPSHGAIAALYEWRRESDGARRYALEEARLEEGWKRAAKPLCRVWRAEEQKQPGLRSD